MIIYKTNMDVVVKMKLKCASSIKFSRWSMKDFVLHLLDLGHIMLMTVQLFIFIQMKGFCFSFFFLYLLIRPVMHFITNWLNLITNNYTWNKYEIKIILSTIIKHTFIWILKHYDMFLWLVAQLLLLYNSVGNLK